MSAADGGYAALLRLRGAGPLLCWVSLARLVYGGLPLAMLLLLADARQSYAEAGVAVAVYGLAAGVLAPARGRLVDRVGIAAAIPLLSLLFALSAVCLVLTASAPFAVVLVCAFVGGATPPPVGPVMRAAWRLLTGAQEGRLRRAYALDAIGEEVVYVVGPLLAAILIAWLGASVVVTLDAGVMVIAGLGIACSRLSHQVSDRLRIPAETSSQQGVRAPLWRDRRFLLGLVPAASLGFLLGGVEIASVAAAIAGASTAAIGIPAAAVSAGSVLGGVVFGRRVWPGTSRSQALVLALAAASLVVVAGLATGAFVLLVSILSLVGLCIAPAIVCSYLIVDESAPVAATEGQAWVNAAFNSCLAVGSGLAGVLVGAASPRLAMLVLAVIAAIAVLASSVAMRLSGRAGTD